MNCIAGFIGVDCNELRNTTSFGITTGERHNKEFKCIVHGPRTACSLIGQLRPQGNWHLWYYIFSHGKFVISNSRIQDGVSGS